MADSELKQRASEYFRRAYEHQQKGEYEEAIELYSHSIEAFPTAEAYTFRGWAYSYQRNYTQAIAGNPQVIGQAAPYAPFGADGYPAIDQVTGKVFEAAGFHNQDGTWSELLNIGTPDSTGSLTFLDQGNTDAANLPRLLIHIADGLPASPEVLFTVLSMDTGRNLFITYSLSADASVK